MSRRPSSIAPARKKFFTLPVELTENSATFRTPTNKVCFVGLAGYFRSRRKFFGKQLRLPDIEFIATRLGLPLNEINLDAFDKQTYAREQQLILEAFG